MSLRPQAVQRSRDGAGIGATLGGFPFEPVDLLDDFDGNQDIMLLKTEDGANARTVSRTLDSLRAQGHLSEGVNLSNGGRLRIIFQNKGGNGNVTIGDNTVDGRSVAVALGIQKGHPHTRTLPIRKHIALAD